MKKIAILVADYPPFISGYSYYNHNLFSKLSAKSSEIYLITTMNKLKATDHIYVTRWNICSIRGILLFLKKNRINIVNIQYPNLSYGKYNLIPHILVFILRVLGYTVITTIHEYSNIHFIRRLSEIIFLIFSNIVIVTSSIEKEAIKNLLLINDKKIETVIIGSNIPIIKKSAEINRKIISYFGMFYPDKKVKEVIDFLRHIETKSQNKLTFRMIGASHPYYNKYFKEIFAYGNRSIKNLDWKINLSQDEIAHQFSEIYISILFFNDGASLRRGSLLASIINGIPIITNKGNYAEELRMIEGKGLFYVDINSHQGIKYVFELLSDKDFYDACANELIKYSYKFSFDRVINDYEKILEK